MSKFRATLVLAGLAAARLTRADPTPLGVVFVDEPVSLEIRVANATHADLAVAKAVPTCECLQPIFGPTTIAAGSATALPFTYLAHRSGEINVNVEFEDAAGHPVQRATVRGFVAQHSWFLSPEQLHALPTAEVVVVDVRSAARFAEVHLARAINVLPFALKTRTDLRGKRVVLVDDGCEPGVVLAQTMVLRENGFRDVTILRGGVPAWVRAGFPVEGSNRIGVLAAMITPADFARASASTEWRVVEVSRNSDHPAWAGAMTVSDWEEIPKLADVPNGLAKDRPEPLLVVASDPATYGRIENALSAKTPTPVYYLTGGHAALETYRAAQVALATSDHRTYQSTPPSKSHPAVTGGGCSSCGR